MKNKISSKSSSSSKPSIPSDNLRCKRSDGRKWRCSNPSLPNSHLCKHHYDSITQKKTQKPPLSNLNPQSKPSMKKKKKPQQNQNPIPNSDSESESDQKPNDLIGLELFRGIFVNQIRSDLDYHNKNKGDVIVKDFPNCVMTISKHNPSPLQNAVMFGGKKLGMDFNRCLKSKNPEFAKDFAAFKALPFGGRSMSLKCHLCDRSTGLKVVGCQTCRKEAFCYDCIRKRYSSTPEEVMKLCPVCCGTCECKICDPSEVVEFEERQRKIAKIINFHYMVCLLLPVLKQFNEDQKIELELEATIKGRKLSEIQIQQVECDYHEKLCCDYCKTSIVDFHRSCSNCSYDLCLSCCREIRNGSLPRPKEMSMLAFPNKGKAYMHGGKPLPEAAQKRMSSPRGRYGKKSSGGSTALPEWTANKVDGSISCPSKEYGGCANCTLDLRHVFPLNWTEELERRADEVVCSYDIPEILNASDCDFCIGRDTVGGVHLNLKEAAARDGTDDNFLYCPTRHEVLGELEHFQNHWIRGHPIIVRDVLQNKPHLNWDPSIMLGKSIEKSIADPDNHENKVKAIDCLDWCEVEIETQKFLDGYLEGRTHPNMWPEMLKLKDWPSPISFQEMFPSHSDEFIRSLPFQDYVNPESGLHNLSVQMPKECLKPDMGPRIHMSYGMGQELGRGDSVTKLFCDTSDVVNVLVHTADVVTPGEQLDKINELKKKHKAQDKRESRSVSVNPIILKKEQMDLALDNIKTSCAREVIDVDVVKDELPVYTGDFDCHSEVLQKIGFSEKDNCEVGPGEKGKTHSVHLQENLVNASCGARWDVFRREDVPKLNEYLNKYSEDFRHIYCAPVEHVTHPILDRCFYLDSKQKRRLKEEFRIEPWTFDQHLGEAIIIPAGCPYQIRNLKSCVNVELDFVSPENVCKSIELINELRLLPQNHKAKEDRLEVKKMSIYGIEAAIKEIQGLAKTLR